MIYVQICTADITGHNNFLQIRVLSFINKDLLIYLLKVTLTILCQTRYRLEK